MNRLRMKTCFLRLLLVVVAPIAMPAASTGSFITRQQAAAEALAHPRSSDWPPDVRIAVYSHPRTTDRIEIVEVTPQKLEAGKEQEVTVRIRYTLIASPKGVISLGFNVGTSTTFRLLKERWVEAGQGEIEFRIPIQPARWPDGRPFKAYANLASEVRARARSSLVSHAVALKFN
jgi:hypothetical protein